MFSACDRPQPLPELADLQGQILPRQPFVILPNRAWRQHQTRKDLWFFGRSASILCHILEEPKEAITFAFYPEDPDHPPSLRFTWDGEDLTDQQQILSTGEIQISIEPERLTSGQHFLNLAPTSKESGGEPINAFQFIGYRLGNAVETMPIKRIFGYRYLADLLQFSLSGSYGNEKMNGFVFEGPHTETVRLPTDRGGRFLTKVQNSTASLGILTLQAGEETVEVELKAHQKNLLSIDIAPGVDRLTLTTKATGEGFFLWGAPHFQSLEAPQQPPIVLLTLDTTRRDMLAAYGGDPGIAPHLNAFAENATVFENAVTTAPWTLPSHASMFTGLYPSKHGAGVINDHLEGQFDTLAEKLRRENYLTFGFAGGTLASFRFGLGQGFSLYTNPYGFETRADQLTEDALTLLDRYGLLEKEREQELPFFLFMNYFDPHYPFNAPRTYQARFDLLERLDQRGADDPWAQVVREPGPAWEKIVEGELLPRAKDHELLRDAYRAEVAFMDDQIGRIFSALKEAGHYEEALIIAVADHGELLGEKGFFSHSSRLDSELMEVPMIVKWPQQKTGQRVDATVSVVDLFPTVLRAAGLPVPEQDGLELHDRGGEGLEERPYVAMEEHDNDFHRLSPFMKISDHLFGFQTPDYKQWTWDEGDLCQTRENQSWRRAACQEETASRPRRWRRWLEQEAFQPTVQRIGLSKEERSKLRALGYL